MSATKCQESPTTAAELREKCRVLKTKFHNGENLEEDVDTARDFLHAIVLLRKKEQVGTADWQLLRSAEPMQELLFHHIRSRLQILAGAKERPVPHATITKPLETRDWIAIRDAMKVAIVATDHEFVLRVMTLLLDIKEQCCVTKSRAVSTELRAYMQDGGIDGEEDPYTRIPAYAKKLREIHSFYDAATCIPALSYQATEDSAVSSASLSAVRFAAAYYITSDYGESCLPQHVRVSVATDLTGVARAFVCVSYRPKARPKKKGDSAAIAGGAYDVMLGPEDLPKDYYWQAENALILFTGTESSLTWLATNFKLWEGSFPFELVRGWLHWLSWGMLNCPRRLYALSEQKDGINGFTHFGFATMLDGVWDQIKVGLRDPHDPDGNAYGYMTEEKKGASDKTVWVLGHSLGGALATLCAARIHALFQQQPFADKVLRRAGGDPRVWLTTIAAPRCLNDEAKSMYKELPIAVKRICMEGDPVVSLPPKWYGLSHVGWTTVIRQVQPQKVGLFGTFIRSLTSVGTLRCHSSYTYRSSALRHTRDKWILDDVDDDDRSMSDDDVLARIEKLRQYVDSARNMFPTFSRHFNASGFDCGRSSCATIEKSREKDFQSFRLAVRASWWDLGFKAFVLGSGAVLLFRPSRISVLSRLKYKQLLNK